MPDGLHRQEGITGESAQARSAETGDRPGLERIAEIALLGKVGSRSIYSYRVPETLADKVGAGHLVQVPFRSRAMQGVTLSVDLGDSGNLRLRDIIEVLDPLPCLTSAQIDLAQWIAAYYVCGLGAVLALMLPAGLDRETVTTYTDVPGADHPESVTLTAEQTYILELVRKLGRVTAAQLPGTRDPRRRAGPVDALVRLGLVVKVVSLGRAAVAERTELLVVLQPREQTLRLSARQQTLVDYLNDLGGEANWSDIRADLRLERATLTRLTHKHVVLTYPRHVRRDPLALREIPRSEPPEFTVEQAAVYKPIERALRTHEDAAFLLHGITGSGKTEVYLRAVADTLAAGRQAIVLVPEIGLTPQAVERFASRFPGQVALLHSGLSDGERYDEWQRIRRGECSVAIGPRSAIFSPFSRLGLIVVDEEHDPSYKQDTPAPRYHTRDVALRLARASGATVILGSATPDVVSFFKAAQGNYTLLTMHARVRGAASRSDGAVRQPFDATVDPNKPAQSKSGVTWTSTGLPPVQIVDMRLELKSGNRSIFSRALALGLEQTLSRGEQAICF